ncbi:MAG: hypothetical protein ABSH41_17125 [Syntrophobacteraceae bacterium]
METPSHKLAEKIIERLIREELLTDKHGKKLLPKLAEGKLSQEDWSLAIELSDAEERKP